MRRILANTPSTITTVFSSDETAIDADGNAVKVTVTGPTGAVVHTVSNATHGLTGEYSFVLPPQPKVSRLTIAWEATFGGADATITDVVEIVGGRLATIPQVLALDGVDPTVFSNADIAEGITWAESVIENYCGTRFVPAYAEHRFTGAGSGYTRLPHPFIGEILSVVVDGASVPTSAFQVDELGWFAYLDDYFPAPQVAGASGNVTVCYSHGTGVVPADIALAARTLARHYCLDLVSRIPDRALSVQSDFGQIQMAQAGGVGRPTPFPDVNAALNRNRHRWAGVL